MGYTHYFTFKKTKGTKAAELETAYQKAVDEVGQLARYWNTTLHPKGSATDASRLSGYTAHVKPKAGYRGVKLNGKGDNGHEDFCLREHFKENVDARFSFCKTAEKPYDTVVVAALSILKHRLGDAIEVSSDGGPADWAQGVALAGVITRCRVKNPLATGLRLVS